MDEQLPTSGRSTDFARVAWAGFGHFGLPIAERVCAAGVRVGGLTSAGRGERGLSRLRASAPGAAMSIAAGDVAAYDALVTCLPRPDDVVELVGALPELPPVVVDLTTGSPATSRELFERLRARGVLYVDAPVSGSREAARAGTLTVTAGCAAGRHPAVDGFFRVIAGSVFYFDRPGQGNAAKLVNQLMHLSIMGVIGESLRLAGALGLDLSASVRAVQASSGGSKMLDRFGESVVRGDFSPHFTLDLALKDLHLVEEASAAVGGAWPYRDLTRGVYAGAAERGMGALNFSVVAAIAPPEDEGGTAT